MAVLKSTLPELFAPYLVWVKNKKLTEKLKKKILADFKSEVVKRGVLTENELEKYLDKYEIKMYVTLEPSLKEE